MKKLKNKSGITLVALIITIIILLILAVVTISAVNEGNLFAHANNAATRYTAESELENTKIADWLTKMEQYDGGTPDGGTPVDPNNPLIGKNFNMVVGGTNVNIIKNIAATTMSIFDTDEDEWIDNVPYTYDSTNKILTISLGEDTINADITLLDNNIIVVVSEGLFLTSNGGTSASLLNGYSSSLGGAVIGETSYYNLQFGTNNVASFDGTLNTFYAIADDNSSNDGTFYGYIDYLGLIEVTKVDGVYTKFNYVGLDFTLTPPQS